MAKKITYERRKERGRENEINPEKLTGLKNENKHKASETYIVHYLKVNNPGLRVVHRPAMRLCARLSRWVIVVCFMQRENKLLWYLARLIAVKPKATPTEENLCSKPDFKKGIRSTQKE